MTMKVVVMMTKELMMMFHFAGYFYVILVAIQTRRMATTRQFCTVCAPVVQQISPMHRS